VIFVKTSTAIISLPLQGGVMHFISVSLANLTSQNFMPNRT